MKKTYVSPLMTEVNVEAEQQMLAASVAMFSNKEVDTSDPSNQLGKDNDRAWGNLWGK